MRLLALLFTFLLIASACGGDDDAGPDPDALPDIEDTETAAGDDGDDPGASDDGSGPVPAPATGDGPQVGDHWHAAYGIFICDSFVEPIRDDSDPEGIHTHADGVIHIHPFLESAAGDNATLAKFFEAVQLELTDTGIIGAGGSLEEGFDCLGEPGEFKVARWHLYGLEEDPAIVEEGIADIRFVEDLEVYTIAMVPAGTEIPQPPSIPALGTLSDVDPDQIPELPEGFTVASVPPPGEGETISGETPCPEPDGSSPRTTEFDQPPPLCIDPDRSYTATFVTNFGDVVVELDTENTPETVNNFVVLAQYGYYDDTAMFRTAPSIAIIQGGAPHSNSGADVGPGYTIEDEADGFSYQPGDLAMARTSAPNSSSAQYFFSTGPETANLDGPPGNPDGSGRGTYVVFGRTVEGLDVLEEIISLHVEDIRLQGGGPGRPVIVETILIEES